jgi:hypothetical protein
MNDTTSHTKLSNDQSRWILAASLLAERFGERDIDDEDTLPTVPLQSCDALLTDVESGLGCLCRLTMVKPDGASVVARMNRPPSGAVELSWKTTESTGGPHRFLVLDAEETEPNSWAITLRWIGFDAAS